MNLKQETIWKHPFSEVISTRKVRAEDGTLFLDMKCGNLMVQKISRIQTDQVFIHVYQELMTEILIDYVLN